MLMRLHTNMTSKRLEASPRPDVLTDASEIGRMGSLCSSQPRCDHPRNGDKNPEVWVHPLESPIQVG